MLSDLGARPESSIQEKHPGALQTSGPGVFLIIVPVRGVRYGPSRERPPLA